MYFKINLAVDMLKIGLQHYGSKNKNKKLLGFLNFESLWQFSSTQLIN